MLSAAIWLKMTAPAPFSLIDSYSVCSDVDCEGPHAECYCKWCRRSRNTINPLKSHPSKHIPWRRPVGRICGICPWVMALMPELKGKSTKELEAWFSIEENYTAFMHRVVEWEEGKNKNPNGHRSRTANSSGINQRVEAVKSDVFRMEEEKGVFWPMKIFRKYESRKPSRKELTTIEFQGQKLSGVVRDASCGLPLGVIKLSAVSDTGVVKHGELCNSYDAIDDQQVEDTYKTAVKKQKVSTSVKQDAEGKVTGIKLVAAAAPADDSSEGDDNALDDVQGSQ